MNKKMIFLNDDNFKFCDLDCDTCPIKFVCLTTKATGFSIKWTKKKWWVDCYYDEECNKRFFRYTNKLLRKCNEK